MTTTGRRGRDLDVEVLERLFTVEHLSFKQIARQLGSTDVTVAAALRARQLSPPPGQTPPGRSAAPAPPVSIDLTDLTGRYDQGASVRQIAVQTGLARDRVAVELREAGAPLRGRGARPAGRLDDAAVRRSYEQGASLRQLAIQHGTDDHQVRHSVLRAGGTIRSRGAQSQFSHLLTATFLHERHVLGRTSVADIAAEVGCSVTTVYAALRRHRLRQPAR